MLRIECPYCGLRDEPEFSFGGPAHVTRPPFTASDVEWTDYLYVRENRKGIHCERWLHTFGCRRWFNVVRHTVTHEIVKVYTTREPRPDLEQWGGS